MISKWYICPKKNLRTLLKWKHLAFLEKVEKAEKIMTHKIGMMTSSKQPPVGHNKYHFLKVKVKVTMQSSKFISFSVFEKNRGGG